MFRPSTTVILAKKVEVVKTWNTNSWKRVNERKETEKKLTFFLKQSPLAFRSKNYKASMLFEFQYKFMVGTFLIKLTRFEKTGSIGTFFKMLGNLEKKIRN